MADVLDVLRGYLAKASSQMIVGDSGRDSPCYCRGSNPPRLHHRTLPLPDSATLPKDAQILGVATATPAAEDAAAASMPSPPVPPPPSNPATSDGAASDGADGGGG